MELKSQSIFQNCIRTDNQCKTIALSQRVAFLPYFKNRTEKTFSFNNDLQCNFSAQKGRQKANAKLQTKILILFSLVLKVRIISEN